MGELHTKVIEQQVQPDDLEVQVAIATDIAVVSPLTFPAIAGILSHMISLAPKETKKALWDKVCKKMSKVPYNGTSKSGSSGSRSRSRLESITPAKRTSAA